MLCYVTTHPTMISHTNLYFINELRQNDSSLYCKVLTLVINLNLSQKQPARTKQNN